MKRQLFKTSLLLIISLAVISCRYSRNEDSDTAFRPPNVIYVYADDLGYGELGSYGQDKIKTPNLDRMAAEGMRFTRHYTGTPVCHPARAILMTGQHAGHVYIRGNYSIGGGYDKEGGNMPLPKGSSTIGDLMQDAGYTTGAIGKWSLGAAGSIGEPVNLGFDYFYGYLNQSQAHNYYPQYLRENDKWDTLPNDYFVPRARLEENASPLAFEAFEGKTYAPDKMTEKAIEFINKNKEQPFFLYLPYPIPHGPITIPSDSEAYNMYRANGVVAKNVLDKEAVHEMRVPWDTVAYLGDEGYTPHPQPRAAYAAMITQLDMYVGEIMQQIKELGLDDNTIIMFSSDNGTTFNAGVEADFFNSTGELRGLKMDLFEGGIRVPFIARWPGHIPKGEVTDHISVQYDMMATLADLVNLDAPENDGVSMLPTLLGQEDKQKKHDFLYFEYPGDGGQLAIIINNWKGIKANMKENPDAKWQLYNLQNDIAESKNVAAEHPAIVVRMDSIVQREHEPSHIQEWNFVDPIFSETKESQIEEFERNRGS